MQDARAARPKDNGRTTGPALEAAYRFQLWLIPTVEKFPRSQKFLLGDRIQGAALDVVERLIEATYSRDRRPTLQAANLSLEKLRFFLRLSLDLHLLDPRRFEHAARGVDEIGRLVGGWIKAERPAQRGHGETHGDARPAAQ